MHLVFGWTEEMGYTQLLTDEFVAIDVVAVSVRVDTVEIRME